ncbi:hypothetical protein [uncultured Campylobacter sp.]|uniref:hypothetical protein n=1 Tax=uncultured Campylobacter sp. TaxID=218934 RepID=UPI00261EC71A|nr:hypothetical protein [uncultured Campylobacter sp.]
MAILYRVCKILPLNSIFKSRALSTYRRRILSTQFGAKFKAKFHIAFYGKIPRHNSIIIKFCRNKILIDTKA